MLGIAVGAHGAKTRRSTAFLRDRSRMSHLLRYFQTLFLHKMSLEVDGAIYAQRFEDLQSMW